MKRLTSAIILILFLIGTLTLKFNTQLSKSEWTGTVYIRADGSIDPPTAPITTVDNVTYMLTDNITSSADGIVVERDNIVIDGGGHTLQGTGAYPYKGVDLSHRSNVTIKNTKIATFYYGIWLYHSSNNLITENNVAENTWDGIYIDHSSNNIVTGNNIKANSRYGICLGCSSNNFLRNNCMFGNKRNFGVLGETLSHFINDVDSSNTVDGKPICYWINRQNEMVPMNAGYVTLVNCANVTVKNLNLKNNIEGLLLAYTKDSFITNNVIAKNQYGIWLYSSFNNIICDNNIAENIWAGIEIDYSSNNTIYENSIANNYYEGISLDNSSSNNMIYRNNVTNNRDGIYLHYSSNNTISLNNITVNELSGIYLDSSGNNSILANVFTGDGMRVESSYQNIVENNSVNDKPLVYLEEASDLTVENAGQVILIKCKNVTLENLNLSNTDIAIQLDQTQKTQISRNNITNNCYGLLLSSSANNSISNNNITSNENVGIGFWFSDSNSIVGNNVINNGWVSRTGWFSGIYIYFGGITVYYSSSNSFYHNNFIYNRKQVYAESSVNTWDDGYPAGGNFWSDYIGQDLDEDGIGDTPYVIDENNIDQYPLMRTWGYCPVWLGSIYIRTDGSVDPPDAPVSTVDKVTYTLLYDVFSSADGIIVEKSNVIIDGADHTLQGTGDYETKGVNLPGISNVTVKNINIKGFEYGIMLSSSINNTICRCAIKANERFGIYVYESSNNIICENEVKDTDGNGILLQRSSGNVIDANVVASNDGSGIVLSGSSSNLIKANNIMDNGYFGLNYGIELTYCSIWEGCWPMMYSDNNTIIENNITRNTNGIGLVASSYNTIIANNIINNSRTGIILENSVYNTLRDNNIAGSKHNFGVYAKASLWTGLVRYEHFIHDIDVSNKVNGKSIYYLINQKDLVISSSDIGYLALVNCTNMTVENLSLANNIQGLLLAFTTNSTIENATIAHNRVGICAICSYRNTISANSISRNEFGINLYHSTLNNITKNNLTDNAGFYGGGL